MQGRWRYHDHPSTATPRRAGKRHASGIHRAGNKTAASIEYRSAPAGGDPGQLDAATDEGRAFEHLIANKVISVRSSFLSVSNCVVLRATDSVARSVFGQVTEPVARFVHLVMWCLTGVARALLTQDRSISSPPRSLSAAPSSASNVPRNTFPSSTAYLLPTCTPALTLWKVGRPQPCSSQRP